VILAIKWQPIVKSLINTCCGKTVPLILFILFLHNSSRTAPIPTGLNKNVVQFIFAKVGETNYIPDGTCFCVQVQLVKPKPRKGIFYFIHPKQTSHILSFIYFVTAKHVLFDSNGNIRQELYFRESKTDGGVQYAPLSQDITNDLRILAHPDKSVDLAVIAFKRSFLVDLLNGKINDKDELNDILFSDGEVQFREGVWKLIYPE
jgi:hypothetical protein